MDKLKLAAHAAALSPLLLLAWDYSSGGLTADPIREVQLRTGKDALVLLVLTFAVAPARIYLGLNQLQRVRRILGVYAFVYASIHFLNFAGLDYGFNPGLLYGAVFEKPFALVGLATYLLLIPLAVTSTNAWARRLGKNWKRLHRIMYIAVPLATIHFYWARTSKLNSAEPLLFIGIVVSLLFLRLPALKHLAK